MIFVWFHTRVKIETLSDVHLVILMPKLYGEKLLKYFCHPSHFKLRLTYFKCRGTCFILMLSYSNFFMKIITTNKRHSSNIKCCDFQEVKDNSHNYDAWFDYLRLMENEGEVDQTREVYERAIANVPPSQVKISEVYEK